MNPSDDQLSAWLRDVSVPDDLTERLLAISRESIVRHVWRRREVWGAGMLVAAASLILAFSVFQWQHFELPRETMRAESTPSIEPENRAVAEASAIVDEFQSRQRLIEIALARFSESEETKTDPGDRPLSWAHALVPTERASLIIGLADQSALEWGGDPQRVAFDMERLIEQFPSTAGADLAHQYLAQSKK